MKYWIIKSAADPEKYAVIGANRPPAGVLCVAPEGATTSDGKYITVEEVEINGIPTNVATLDSVQKAADEAAKQAAEDALAPQRAVESAIRSAMQKGNIIIEKFAVENVMLGITVDNMTGTVLDVMAPVTEALRSGSLYEAISRIKAIDPSDKDVKYITDSRLLAAVNELEEHLGIELSETL